ncbi:GNAT family N-acetyltransferase [Kineococcus glutinatus]|uniref:GNAT family N-acetyltransferase n=1 Tax=Kineococcus glutinatus TaxID=1070872 RepID=A0ABP9I460_9ACTN
MDIECSWRGGVGDGELERLHAEAFGHPVGDTPWGQRLARYSVGWVCARDDGRLVGFVNVIGDGGVHAVLLDTATAASHRRRGIGRRLVATARDGARAAGCEWLHVDHEPHLAGFYRDACGFEPTAAGLLRL